jgi:hypothetical protein
MEKIQQCESCSRSGTRGFKTISAGTASTSVGLVAYPAITLCVAQTSCSRRAYRLTPLKHRAAVRFAMEVNA